MNFENYLWRTASVVVVLVVLSYFVGTLSPLIQDGPFSGLWNTLVEMAVVAIVLGIPGGYIILKLLDDNGGR